MLLSSPQLILIVVLVAAAMLPERVAADPSLTDDVILILESRGAVLKVASAV